MTVINTIGDFYIAYKLNDIYQAVPFVCW